jgi:uncharacterized protein YjbJ (UPF0337 family)
MEGLWTDRRQSSRSKSNEKEAAVNTDVIKGQWHQLKGEVKRQWGKLTDDEVDQVEGNAEKLSGLLQQRYGYARDRAEREIDDWLATRPTR